MSKLETKLAAAALLGAAVFAFMAPARAGDAEAKGDRCHAIGETGNSKHDQAPPFRQVVTRYPLENLAESLAEGILSGHPDMPEFVFQPDEIDAVLSYLEDLKAKTAGDAPKPEEPK